jgi:tetratricopeptide (TPR) repeat protein
MPANWPNDSLQKLGFSTSFVNFYISQNKRAGAYIRQGQIWTVGSQQDIQRIIDEEQKREMAKVQSEKARAEREVGINLLFQGNYNWAMEKMSKSIELDPTNWQAYQLRGLCYTEMDDNEKANSDFAQAEKLGRPAGFYRIEKGNTEIIWDPKKT